MMQLIVTVKKLNRRSGIPASFSDKSNIVGTVLQGFKFEADEVAGVPNPSLGKWYKDKDGFYYWGGGVLVSSPPVPVQKPITISGLPANLPPGFIAGADVSHYNAKPDWAALVKAGISFVYIKLTEGKHTADPLAGEHATNAAKNGLKFGYYHFCHPGKSAGGTPGSDASAEAELAIRQMKAMPAAQLPIALDLEIQSELNKSEYLEWIKTFIARLHDNDPNVQPLIYGGKSYFDNMLPAAHGLGGYKLWIAHYSLTDAMKLHCPNGWDDWAIWQFTGSGRVGGNLQIDLNIMKDTSLLP